MQRLFTPRWIAAHVVVLVTTIVFLNLGFWQLRRMEEVQLENTVGGSRFTADPLPLQDLLGAVGSDYESLEYRRATVTGTFDPDSEVLIRSQVYQGSAGFHVITPLVGDADDAVLVNRGWVPQVLDLPPVEPALPPDDEVSIEGWIHLTQTRQGLGPIDPAEGRLTAMARVDIERIAQQVPYTLAPVYVVMLGEQGSELPVPVAEPTFDDNGPHLAYAIQWFGFTIIGLVGYAFLMRRTLRSGD